MITMLLGGLWHGASWNFIIWGGLNGVGLIFYKAWRRISPWEAKDTWYKRIWAIFLTFTFITFTRVWFRAGSKNSWADLNSVHDIRAEFFSATDMLRQIFYNMDLQIIPQVASTYLSVIAVIGIGLMIHWLPENFKKNYRHRFATLPIWAMGIVCFAMIVALYQTTTNSVPFIYFQF